MDNRGVFEVGVFMIVRKGSGILFVRDGEMDSFSLPGGAPHEDIHPATENILETGVRETWEEGCIVVVPTRLIAIFSYQKKLGFLYILEGKLVEELPFEPKCETVERQWVPIPSIMSEAQDDIRIFPAQRAIAQQYIRNLPGNFPLFGSYRDPISIFQYSRSARGFSKE